MQWGRGAVEDRLRSREQDTYSFMIFVMKFRGQKKNL